MTATALLVADGDDGPSATEIERLTTALQDAARPWGRIEVQGMRPAIADLGSGEGVPPETVAGEARAWQEGLRDVAAQLDRIRTTKGLRKIVLSFRRALERYQEAARLFEQAAEAPSDRRQGLLDRGIAEAGEGARLYNEASMELQAARRRAGLPISSDFPDHPAGQSRVDPRPTD